MGEEKQGFVRWVRAHKKELIIAGISFAAVIGVFVGIKEKDELLNLWKSLQSIVKEKITVVSDYSYDTTVNEKIIPFPLDQSVKYPIEVSEHIRNLPEGWKASERKISSAIEHGYTLAEGQTWVDTYIKNCNVA